MPRSTSWLQMLTGSIIDQLLQPKRRITVMIVVLLSGILGIYIFSCIDLRSRSKLVSLSIPFVSGDDCCHSSPLSNQSFSIVYSNFDSNSYSVDAPYLLVVPFSFPSTNTDESFPQELRDSQRRTLRMLGEFLHSRMDFDAVACQQESRNSEYGLKSKKRKANKASLRSSWCRFAQRNWSVQIRNNGRVSKHKFVFPIDTTPSESVLKDTVVVYENCNIVEGPFLIRNRVFHRSGGLNGTFGKLILFEFFIRSAGELKVAKLKTCAWSPEITRTDRGPLEGSPHFLEYARFGNKHNVLRIITENRIEWTTCVANWKLCPEKPNLGFSGQSFQLARSRFMTNIFRPICCRVVLGELLDDIVWAMNSLNLEYRIVYGTLLGAVRSQAIIPWTHDIDIALNESVYANMSTYLAIQELFGNKYFVGEIWHHLRGFRHLPPYVEVDTAIMFDGPRDLHGKKFFSAEIEDALNGMLPISENWKHHGYIDFYNASLEWMNGSSNVIIDGKTFVTIKEINKKLTDWYGEDYMTPKKNGQWTGLR